MSSPLSLSGQPSALALRAGEATDALPASPQAAYSLATVIVREFRYVDAQLCALFLPP